MKGVVIGSDPLLLQACREAGLECEMIAPPVTIDGFRTMRNAGIIVVEAGETYAIGIAHALGKPTVIVGEDRSAEALRAAIRNASNPFFPKTSGRPLKLGPIDPAVQAYLDAHGVTTVEQLKLDEIAAAVSRNALRGFVRELVRTHSYDDQTLQEFMIRRGIFL